MLDDAALNNDEARAPTAATLCGAPLARFLARCGRELLIVSDRYPPHSVGGAEISLHLCCSRREMAGRVLVTVFSREVSEATLYWHENVPVVMLPDADPWPVHRRLFGSHRAAARSGPWSRAAYEIGHGAAFLLAGGGPAALPDRASALCFELGRKPRGGIASDFSLGPAWHRRREMQALVAALKPRRVLLDNYRSILLGPGIRRKWPEVELVAVVRDNRFTCVRHDQSRQVGGKPCTACDFQCAEADAPGRALWHRRHLRLSAQTRLQALATADRVVVTSAFLEREIGALVGAQRVTRIPNPGGNLDQTAAFIRGVPELPGQNLLIIGMLNENKGQLQFIRRAADWLRLDRTRHIHLAGRGDRIAARIRDFAEAEDLAHQITLHGYLDRPALFRLARQCQVVVAPAIWPEPFGRVPLEAGLARRPVVAFARGGLTESIVDGETGALVPPEDYPQMIARIDQLMQDPALRHQMGVRAYCHISQRYNLDDIAEAFLKVFEQPLPARRA
ncbi:glycosyltransferase family 4 protein [Rhodobacteraceae bacterium NNCM2]|nr:glycosyltransferase family 4 protein [Coraliihabitans acroporae]